MPKQTTRLAVQKIYKLFIGGKFARGESGRIIAARDGEDKLLANYCRASRKDFCDAVPAGRNAVAGWTKCSALFARPDFISRGGNARNAAPGTGERAFAGG
jgi:hypothetical protein